MASKPVLWRNSSPNSRMPTTQRYSDWPHSQKNTHLQPKSSSQLAIEWCKRATARPKKTGKRVTLEMKSEGPKILILILRLFGGGCDQPAEVRADLAVGAGGWFSRHPFAPRLPVPEQ